MARKAVSSWPIVPEAPTCPLHGGRVPRWLGQRMTRLGAVISEAIVHHYGRDELLRRLAHPFWFQSFGAVMGMDWHSSGITTSVIGALKRGLDAARRASSASMSAAAAAAFAQTPHELVAIGERVGFDGAALAQRQPAGRQGRQRRRAGRLRALSARLHRHRRRPLGGRAAGHERRHAAGAPLPLAVGGPDELRRRAACGDRGPGAGRDRQPDRPARRSVAARPARASAGARPDRIVARSCAARGTARVAQRRARSQPLLPHLVMPAHHDVRASDVVMRRLHGDARRGRRPRPRRFRRPAAGARASARAPCRRWRWSPKSCTARPAASADPARFSLAHGGKDRHPFPVPTRGL